MQLAMQPMAARLVAPAPHLLQAPGRKGWQLQDGLVACALAFTWCREARNVRSVTRRRAVGDIQIAVATSGDLPQAAALAVRSLRWTRGWLDAQDFSEDDYALLAGREVMGYQSLYLADNGFPSTFLVAKRQEEKKETSWLDFGSGSSSRVVGCVGCEVKCFNRLTSQELPITQYDGGTQTVLRPVMADLAVSSDCRGQGLGRRLVERLEEEVRQWGYDELVLLVEATNFQARGVYEKLSYRLAQIRPSEVTFYLDKSGGGRQVAERSTVALLLRKSLKPFPQGTLENLNWGQLLVLAALATASQTTEVQDLLKDWQDLRKELRLGV